MPTKKERMCNVTVHTFTRYGRTEFRRIEEHPCYLNVDHDGSHRC